MSSEQPLLSVRDLRVSFRTEGGRLPVVDGVSFDLQRGETLALVGESGSGKSLTALAIMGLLPEAASCSVGGEIWYGDTELTALSAREYRRIRGRRIAMVFQEPMSALNPLMTIGEQVAEGCELHVPGAGWRSFRRRAVEMLDEVGIRPAAECARQYPHQFSGGMRQRALIAMALGGKPELLIADEPTTALDVTLQAEILQLLRTLRQEHRLTVLLITHDLAVVAQTADRVAIMYAGRIVEQAPVAGLLDRPLHPYTQGLVAAIPSLTEPRARLIGIDGAPPAAGRWPRGCRFHPRCPLGRDDPQCQAQDPAPVAFGPQREASCFKVGQ